MPLNIETEPLHFSLEQMQSLFVKINFHLKRKAILYFRKVHVILKKNKRDINARTTSDSLAFYHIIKW